MKKNPRVRFAKLVCLALFLGLAGCQPAPAALTLAPTAAPPATMAPAPSTVAPTAVQPTAAPAAAQAATTFSSNKFKLPMTFVFGPDWYVEDDYPELVTVSRKGSVSVAFNIVTDASLFDPATGNKVPFPQDFATWLKDDPDFAVGTVQPVTVAGIDGLQIDATPVWRSTTARIKRFLAVNNRVTWNLVTDPEKWRFIMLDDVNGQRVLVLMIASVDRLDAAMQDARQILDNVMIAPPAAATPSAVGSDAGAAPVVVEYEIPTRNSDPGGIVMGPDGAVWFVETNSNRIGRVSPSGEISEYSVPTNNAIDPTQGFIAVGPDGALWFNEDLAFKVGRITTSGEFTEYDLPTGLAPIRGFAIGPEGNLWMTALEAGEIVVMTTGGEIIARYELPDAKSLPVSIMPGPDGALWFTDAGTNAVGRITTTGDVTMYSLPPTNGAEGPPVIRMAPGPDGAMWFTMYAVHKIGRIDMAGNITTYDVAGMGPVGIIGGPGERVCFTGYKSNEIGCLSMAGELTRIAAPTGASVPYHLVTDGDGRLWFTEQKGNKVGVIHFAR